MGSPFFAKYGRDLKEKRRRRGKLEFEKKQCGRIVFKQGIILLLFFLK